MIDEGVTISTGLNVNYKKLLIKYVCHVSASDGFERMANVDVAPCGMLLMEFTEQEKECFEGEIFNQVKKWDKNPT